MRRRLEHARTLRKKYAKRRSKGALVEAAGTLDEAAGTKQQDRCSKYQTPASIRTPVQDVREAIAKLGNIALKYMSTNTEKFVHIVIGEPEAEACFGHD